MPKLQTQPDALWRSVKNWRDAELASRYEDQLLLVLTLLLGAIIGLVVVAFILVTENLGARMYPAGGDAWRRFIIPVAGSAVAGLLLYRYFPNARGSGIPQTKTAMFIGDGVITFRTAVGKFLCSGISLGTGIALGREGPSVHVAAGIASSLGRRLGLSPRRVKALVPIGSAAALAAAFNTPIAAVLFTLEEVMGDLHAPVLGSIVISSATSWMVLHLMLGDEPLFHVPPYQVVHPIEFAFYALLGVIGGLVSVAFVKLLLWQRKHFLRMPAFTRWFQPVAGGLTVGILGWFVPQVLGVGYGFVSLALNGQMVLSMMALLVVLKIVATSTCYASGNAGGIFGPSLFIGGMLGGAFGGAAHTLLPDYTASVGAYALIGMGTAFAGIVRVPLASVIMIFEITRDYTIIVPLMISNLLSYFISSRLQKTPIYEALLEQDGIHLPPGARDRQELMTVSQGSHPPPETLSAFETIEQAAARVSQNQESWPVIDQSGLLGMVTLAQMHSAIEAGRGNEPVSALLPQAEYQSDHTDGAGFPHLYSDDPLDTAMRRMAQYDLKVLPVVSRSNMRELKGVISVHDILEAYGLEGNGEPKVPSIPETKASTRVLVGILVIFAFAVALAAFLTNYYHAESAARAQQYFKQGNSLLAKDRDEEAIENFRNAVSISHTAQYRLALALALVKADRLSEAEIYLNELLRETPNSSLAHLGLARIKRAQGAIPEAIRQYHEAIYGSWPQNPTTDRLKARMELIEMLGQAGRREQAQAELLSLKAEKPPDLAMRKQIGQFFLRFGMPKESIEVFRDILKTAKTDPDALAGEGEAQLALGDLPAAQAALRSAVLHDPENRAYQTRLQFVDEVMVIDPAIHGLDAVERYRRSEKLLEATLDAFNQCVASQATQPPDAYRDTAAKAVKLLGNRGKPTSYTETAETAVALAQQLWQERLRLCGAPGSAGQALSQAIAQVSR